MRYSVYNYGARQYDYYEGGGPSGTHAGSPAARGQTELGATPEQAAWRLPADARKIGSGDLPIGRIASMGGVELSGITSYVVIGLAAYAVWRFMR